MPKALHIISFNVPSPPDYGGVIDVFYGLKALADKGLAIRLHCFQYGRKKDPRLERYCEEVHYYKRRQSILKIFGKQPYIVSTRNSKKLLINLLKDDAPILFHGAHCCALIAHPDLRQRQKIVRMHNVEWQYYRDLSLLERNFFKKLFFKNESKKLKRFELDIIRRHADYTLAISRKDEYYWRKENFESVQFIPAFHPFKDLAIEIGLGQFALFHGDLSVADNEQAALFLIQEVFQQLDYPLVIAGRMASKALKTYQTRSNITIIDSPDETHMQQLMREAHIHVLLSFNEAGLKLKLLQALYCGKHILINEKIKGKEQLGSVVHVCKTKEEWIEKIKALKVKVFSQKDIAFRQRNLAGRYDNQSNAIQIIDCIQ